MFRYNKVNNQEFEYICFQLLPKKISLNLSEHNYIFLFKNLLLLFIYLFFNYSVDSFNSVSQWIKDARDLGRPDICIILVGNKLDLKDRRAVEYKTAAKLSLENSIGFIETSATTGENVVEAFTILSKNILNKIESGKVKYK